MNRTYSPKLAEIEHRWYVVDAAGMPLGRLSTLVARLLMGKHKPTYAPHIDTGDFVIVVNAEKAVLTGRKEDRRSTTATRGYPGRAQERDRRRAAPAPADASWSRRRSGACCPRTSWAASSSAS